MYDQKKTVEAVAERSERTAWDRPQIRRMDAGQAEIGSSNLTDGLNTAS